MGIDPGYSFSEQSVLFQEAHNLIVVRCDRRRHPLKIAEDLGPGFEIAAGDFADHERMHQYLPIAELPR